LQAVAGVAIEVEVEQVLVDYVQQLLQQVVVAL
jgi:hypothetical protein